MFTERTNESDDTPQARRLAQTRQAILQNAREMIVAQGIHGLSIRALADSIDYTPGALYKYFSSKEALVDAVRADCFEELNIFIAEQVGTAVNTPEMLLLGGLAYIEYAAQHPQEYHLMFNMEPSHATSGEQREMAMRALLLIVQIGIAQGELVAQGAYDAAAIAYHCWATVHGIASLQATVLLDERDDLPELNRLILQKVIEGFTL
ncbi:MAG: TetR/AcrR family transcriptional regulator [Ardenticatenaceae bacterium]|nr:TetR/AcrR family transcriptional regulator [Anaerolineales bacterium]MCB8941049.1 TetR/AcrR family transcriptional regulator [Ardenticatenaceae bacterium]MCB8972390.1 TetR/AcrR family transcriptional regulator [Ardenticatenaceae bacterium]